MHKFQPINLDSKLVVDSQDVSTIDRLSAAMLFPEDHDMQAEYVRQFSLPVMTAQQQTQRGIAISEEILKGAFNGVIAGNCLTYFHLLQTTEVMTLAGRPLLPSKNAVFYICEKDNFGRGTAPMDRQALEAPTVNTQKSKAAWKSHKKVSHLWAAYTHLKGRNDLPKPGEHIFEDVDVSVLLFLARQYERFIAQYFVGGKTKQMEIESLSAFRVRYFDWCKDDVLHVDIPKLNGLNFADLAGGYTAD
jgi:hypothetical protein